MTSYGMKSGPAVATPSRGAFRPSDLSGLKDDQSCVQSIFPKQTGVAGNKRVNGIVIQSGNTDGHGRKALRE